MFHVLDLLGRLAIPSQKLQKLHIHEYIPSHYIYTSHPMHPIPLYSYIPSGYPHVCLYTNIDMMSAIPTEYECIHTHVHPYIHMYTSIHTCIHPYIDLMRAIPTPYTHIQSHIRTYIHVYTCIHTCIHTFIHRHDERNTCRPGSSHS